MLTARAAAIAFTLFVASCDDDAPAPGAETEAEAETETEAQALPSFTPSGTLALPRRVDYVAVGGGAEPTSSQVSLEQDLELLRELLADTTGVVLHAGGEGAASTYELREGEDAAPDDDPLFARLGSLLDPRESRRARFRQSAIAPNGPSTIVAFEQALLRALEGDADVPLLLYLNGHGDLADVDADNAVLLWGADTLTAFRLSQLLDGAERPVRVVVTSCYSGGFAELAFAGANATRGASESDVCGLFATTADRESSGCDPNPDRRAQEGFALHFLNALAGRDARGQALDAAEVDFDGDGTITLYEAHARARIAGRSIDIPTTTSERWLRQSALENARQGTGAPPPNASPVELAVIRGLADDLDLPDAESAARHLVELEARVEAREARLAEARADADLAWADFRIGLLARWPILDDPWDPRHRPTIEAHREDITRHLDASPAARAYADAQDAIADVDEALLALDDEVARVTRLVRAHDNIRLEAALRASGGDALRTFERLRACEASPLRPR